MSFRCSKRVLVRQDELFEPELNLAQKAMLAKLTGAEKIKRAEKPAEAEAKVSTKQAGKLSLFERNVSMPSSDNSLRESEPTPKNFLYNLPATQPTTSNERPKQSPPRPTGTYTPPAPFGASKPLGSESPGSLSPKAK